jgi:hypothetical protein
VGHVVLTDRRYTYVLTGIWLDNLKQNNRLEDESVSGKITWMKRILKKWVGRVRLDFSGPVADCEVSRNIRIQ